MTNQLTQDQIENILGGEVFSNQIIVQQRSYEHGIAKDNILQTYIDDEYIFWSFLLQIVSVYSFYPIIALMNQQTKENSKLGKRIFDQTMIYAIMFMIMTNFFAEQQCLKHYSFIPLASWHKLINVLLLIEQCSLVLYLGRTSNSISQELEGLMFGVNLIMILVFQEKDAVRGEIKYSIIPLMLNNGYMVYSNLTQLKQLYHQSQMPEWKQKEVQPSPGQSPLVNKPKVYNSIFWYGISIVAYFFMESYNQGLNLQTSREMFWFSCCETVFMISMSMSYFYSWQTYSGGYSANMNNVQQELVPIGFREVFADTLYVLNEKSGKLNQTQCCQKLAAVCEPILSKLELIFGRGGIMPSGHNLNYRKFDYEDDDDELEGPKDLFNVKNNRPVKDLIDIGSTSKETEIANEIGKDLLGNNSSDEEDSKQLII